MTLLQCFEKRVALNRTFTGIYAVLDGSKLKGFLKRAGQPSKKLEMQLVRNKYHIYTHTPYIRYFIEGFLIFLQASL